MPSLPNDRLVPPSAAAAGVHLTHSVMLPVPGRREQPELPFVPRLWKHFAWDRVLQNAAFIALELTGWAFGTTLFLLGGIVLLVLILSQGHLDLFFAQVDNFAARFMSADAARRVVLEQQLVQGMVLATMTLGVLRVPGLLRGLRRELRSKVSAA